MFYELSNDSKYSYDQYSNLSDSLTTLIKETSEGINEMIENSEKYKLKENEIKTRYIRFFYSYPKHCY
mgnify:CR=1 FL=1